MEKLIFKIEELEDALITLDEALVLQKKFLEGVDNQVILMAQDSVIKRFEYCFDCFWKVLKLYLEHSLNIEDVNSPKAVFRACVKQHLFTEEQGDLAIAMVGDRNETSHNYDRVKADEIAQNVQRYDMFMSEVIVVLKQKLGV